MSHCGDGRGAWSDSGAADIKGFADDTVTRHAVLFKKLESVKRGGTLNAIKMMDTDELMTRGNITMPVNKQPDRIKSHSNLKMTLYFI